MLLLAWGTKNTSIWEEDSDCIVIGRGEVKLQTIECCCAQFVSGPNKEGWALCRKSHLCKHKHAYLESYLTCAPLSDLAQLSQGREEKAVFSLTGPRIRLGQWISDISLNLDTRHLQATGTVSNLYFPTTSVCVYLCVLARQPQTTCEISPQWHWVAPLLTFKCYSGTCWFMACSDVHNILT